MGVWQGWQTQLLSAATVPTTGDNRNFLTDWHQHAATDCRNNPVDISRPISGSSNCAAIDPGNRHAQNYASHAQAAGQFRAQLRSGNYPHLLSALESGHPYDVSDSAAVDVSHDLSQWGSGEFANRYGSETFANQGGALVAPGLHKGWHDFRRSVNNHMPKALKKAQSNRRRALQKLGRARKVRL